jgi:site-specific recombinase XerD
MTGPLTNLPMPVERRDQAVAALLRDDLDRAARFARAKKAGSTRKAYRSDFGLFRTWAAARDVSALPAAPAAVAAFLAAEAERGIRPATIGRRLAALRYTHRMAGHPSPTHHEAVRAVLRGIRREKGTAQVKKTPATCDRLIAMAAAGNGGTAAIRDSALLLLGFAGAFRRSELVALDVNDIQETDDGLLITVRKSKTDQNARGQTIAIVRGHVRLPGQGSSDLA